MWWIYNILFVIGFTLLLPRFLWRMARRGGYRQGFMQRFARYDAETRRRLRERPRVWVHAVSVGELFVALRLMAALRQRQPEAAFVVTTTTSTGHRVAAQRLDRRDVLLYFPIDVPLITRRVLDAVQPRGLILTESEFWPNLIRLAHARGVPVVLVNGRISARSFRGYRWVRAFVARTLGVMDCMLMQTEVDRQRLLELGAPAARVRVAGTVKYDLAADGAAGSGRARAWLEGLGVGAADPVILGGSTWPGEELALIRAWRAVRPEFPTARLVLVPRHAERGAEIAALARREGLAVVRRSEAPGAAAGAVDPAALLLADTTGELLDFYGCATVVFVGKSLTEHGGQNFIEPALLGKAVLTGPNLENFAEVADAFRAAGAFRQVRDEGELGVAVRALLQDPAEREAMGRRGHALVLAQQGAVGRMAETVQQVLGL